jgi:hypothetical protein
VLKDAVREHRIHGVVAKRYGRQVSHHNITAKTVSLQNTPGCLQGFQFDINTDRKVTGASGANHPPAPSTTNIEQDLIF